MGSLRIILLSLLITNSCSSSEPLSTIDLQCLGSKSYFHKWLEVYRPQGEVKSVILLVHGLNLKPSVHKELIRKVLEKQRLVVTIKLKGHRGFDDDWDYWRGDDWINEFYQGFCWAKKLAKKEGGKEVHLLAHSLGALLYFATILKLEKHDALFDKVILLAPALSFHWYVSFLKLFYIGGDHFLIASRNREAFRANRALPVKVYREIFSLYERVQKSDWNFLKDIPLLIMMDSRDEIVDKKGIMAMVEKRGPSFQWQEVTPLQGFPRHLIFHPQVLGEKQFSMMIEKMINFLDASK